MFEKARLKLTLWYLLIIMIISGVFSVIIYNDTTQEIRRISHVEELRQNLPSTDFFQQNVRIYVPSIADLEETESRLKLILIIINAGILLLAGTAGYFLAGRTLRPIKVMLDEQNRFISDASHELRTPITAVRTQTEVALRDKNLSLKEAKEILVSNLEEAIGIQTLSNSLLRLTQDQAYNGKTSLVEVDLKLAALEAVKKVNPMAKEKQVKIQSEISDIHISGIKQNIVELIVILLDNAIKYSPENSKVKLNIYRTDGKAMLVVKDEGIGIAKNDIANIFNRFYRAEKSRSKQEVDGYGLGLAIAKKIVQEHNGNIAVKSEPDQGSTFSVSFPIRA